MLSFEELQALTPQADWTSPGCLHIFSDLKADLDGRREVEGYQFVHAVRDLGRCREFVRRRRGDCLQLAWPCTYTLCIQTEADLRLPVSEITRLAQEYLCCEEELVVLGGVWRADLVEDKDLVGIVLAGEDSRIYMYGLDVDDAVYLLAEDGEGFLKRGLKRFYPIYRETGFTDYGVGFLERVIPVSVDSVAHFAASCSGSAFPLPWPRGSFLKTFFPRRRRVCRGEGYAVLVCFASIIGRHLHPLFREHVLAMDRTGAIFAYNPWTDGVIRVCGGIHELFGVGLRPIAKSYRFRSRLSPMWGDQLPRCPHVPEVELPDAFNDVDCVVRHLCRVLDVRPRRAVVSDVEMRKLHMDEGC